MLLALTLAFAQEAAPLAVDPLARFDRVEQRLARDRAGAHHARIVATLVDEEGAPVAGAHAALFGAGNNMAAPGRWLVDATSDERGGIVLAVADWDGRLTLGVDPPDGWLARQLRVSAVDGGVADLGEVVLRRGEDERPRVALSGRVSLPDGSPVGGALVGLNTRDRCQPGATTRTDAAGRFKLSARDHPRSGPDVRAWVLTASGFFPFEREEFGAPEEPWELVLEGEPNTKLEVRGAEPDAVRWSWASGGAWLDSGAELARLVGKGQAVGRWLRAGLDGELPLLRSWWPGHALLFDFEATGAARYTLRVLGSGQPLAGARVDVVEVSREVNDDWWRSKTSAGNRCIASLVTDDEGRVAVRGRADVLYFVFAYADGFEPRRARWKPGEELALELVPRNVPVHCSGMRRGERLELRQAGHTGCVVVRAARDERPFELRLAPAAHDALVLDAEGAVLRGTSFTVARDEENAVDLTRDTRPRIRVNLPAPPPVHQGFVDGWREHGVTVHSWTVVATRTRRPLAPMEGMRLAELDDRGAEIASAGRDDAGAVSFALNGTGTFTLHVTMPPGEVWDTWFQELTVRDGESLERSLPPLDAALHGESRSFRPGPAWHGIAEPRFAFVAVPGAEPTHGWSFVCPNPDQRDGARFELRNLPAGRYFAFHHFVKQSRDVPGGVELSLSPESAAELDDPFDDARFPLAVEVVDARGAPITDGWLRVRDPMHARWISASGSMNDHWLPAPAELRLDTEPLHLPATRAGGIQLEVETDDGVIVRATRRAAPGEPVRVVVPE